MKKEEKILTFKSWINDCEKGTWAIALCDETNYFVEAINCVRDSQMGDKDKNGVYSRHWIADSVWQDELSSLRPATQEEVELYFSYVTKEEAIDFGNGNKKVEVLWDIHSSENGIYWMTIALSDLPWWKKLWNFFRH